MNKKMWEDRLNLLIATALAGGLSAILAEYTVSRAELVLHLTAMGTAVVVLLLYRWRRWLVLLPVAAGVLAVWLQADVSIDLLTIAGVCLLSALIYEILRRDLPCLPLLAGYLIGYVPLLLAASDPPFYSLMFSGGGVLSLLPAIYEQGIRRQEPGRQNISRYQMQRLAVPVVIICMAVTAWLLPADTSQWQSKTLQNMLDDIGQWVSGPFSGTSRYSSNFGLLKSGYMAEIDKLGGDLELDEAEVLRLNAEDPPLWLKGSVNDSYTGTGWTDGGNDGDFRYQSRRWRKYERLAFERDNPAGGAAAQTLYEELTEIKSYELIYMNSDYTTLFMGGLPVDIAVPAKLSREQIYYNRQSELYYHGRIATSSRFQLQSRMFDRNKADFDAVMSELEALTAAEADDDYEEIRERYTVLPDDLPGEVYQTAELITASGGSSYEKARLIEQWLADECRYTLEPGEVPGGEDFVAYFLKTKEGYCTYYASAMAVLARCIGIPSRYVSGFSLGESQEEGGQQYVIQNKHAHAWTEIYIYGIGWVPFDPLGWENGGMYGSGSGVTGTAETAGPEETTIAGAGQRPEAEPETQEFQMPWKTVAVTAFFVLLMLVLIHYLPDLVIRLYQYKFSLSRLERKYPDRTGQAGACYADILQLLAMTGFHVQADETHRKLAERVAAELSFKTDISAVFRMMEQVHYGGTRLERMDIRHLEQVRSDMEQEVVGQIGRLNYLVRRL